MSEDRYAKEMHPKVQELKTALEAIKWNMRACGCGYYQILDHRNRGTAFQTTHDYPELRYSPFSRNMGTFGEKRTGCGAGGAIVFWLPVCEISIHEDKDCVSIFRKGTAGNEMCFMSFYNHDDKPKSKDDGKAE